ncbi:hypothetical protein [Synechococcus elongatus]|uniref:hypothetical protein n=1 Tax=Synechococcus elongatus TaxID=32046 RepID=UPI000F7EC8FA|nr:hypothetical protein [Synechococcus elongatus]
MLFSLLAAPLLFAQALTPPVIQREIQQPETTFFFEVRNFDSQLKYYYLDPVVLDKGRPGNRIEPNATLATRLISVGPRQVRRVAGSATISDRQPRSFYVCAMPAQNPTTRDEQGNRITIVQRVCSLVQIGSNTPSRPSPTPSTPPRPSN